MKKDLIWSKKTERKFVKPNVNRTNSSKITDVLTVYPLAKPVTMLLPVTLAAWDPSLTASYSVICVMHHVALVAIQIPA